MTHADALIIRPATESDGAALLTLARAFATSFRVEPAAFERAFVEILTHPDVCLVVAEENGAVIGYVLGFDHRTFFANGRVAWVEEIMVAQTHRRQGVGRRLMETLEAWAVSRDAKLIALATRRASDFYQAVGYEESAIYFRKRL